MAQSQESSKVRSTARGRIDKDTNRPTGAEAQQAAPILRSVPSEPEIPRSGLSGYLRSKQPPLDIPEEITDNPLPAWARCLKRIVDIAIAAVLLIASLPLLVAATVAIRLTSPGRIIFRQVRLGAGGRPFGLYKLRTMAHDCDEAVHQAYINDLVRGEAASTGGVFKLVADPRITPVGRILRRLSIDELPQLWNVLRGEMSMVGPRPPLPREVLLYDRITWQRLRVKPGLTGLWQVSGRCRLTFAEMVDLDLQYVESWNVWMELRIMLRTPMVILSAKGAA